MYELTEKDIEFIVSLNNPKEGVCGATSDTCPKCPLSRLNSDGRLQIIEFLSIPIGKRTSCRAIIDYYKEGRGSFFVREHNKRLKS